MSQPDQQDLRAADERGGSAEALAQGWCALATVHSRVESRIERALQTAHGLGSTEYSVLWALSRGHDHHMRMQQLAAAVALSQSATTRVVNKLEGQGLLRRHLCATDRRGIYTEVTEAGLDLLRAARPTNDMALREGLAEAERVPELAPLVRVVAGAEPVAVAG